MRWKGIYDSSVFKLETTACDSHTEPVPRPTTGLQLIIYRFYYLHG